MANSRPSMRYVLIHSLNRPRFTVCPGQTWNVPPILNENLMPCHRPDWHGQTCQSGIWTLLGSYTFSFETLVPSTGQLIRPVSTHVCYPSGWLKHPNSRKGEFFLKVLNGWWVVTSHNGRRLEITCAQYRN